jgi:hypothetical protein
MFQFDHVKIYVVPFQYICRRLKSHLKFGMSVLKQLMINKKGLLYGFD